MASGIECVGLALAVLPLVIEAGRAYARGQEGVLNVVLQSRRDQRLQAFYDDFYYEIAELHQRVKGIVSALRLATERKSELANVACLEAWIRDADVEKALQTYFITTDKLNIFMHVMTKLVSLLAQLVEDRTIHVEAADANQTQMYNKLKRFALDRDSKQTSSNFLERFIFWKRDKTRTNRLKHLHIWNERLDRLVPAARTEPPTASVVGVVSRRKVPSLQRRRLSRQLYHALSSHWNCCPTRHEARFCLKVQEENNADDDKAAEFDFLVSMKIKRDSQWAWQEGHIIMRSGSMIEMNDRDDLKWICDALGNEPCEQRLHLLVEDLNGCQKFWQLRSQPKGLRILDSKSTASLESLLRENTKLGLKDKRGLALILSHSLLQYHDSEWLPSEWDKTHISFFHFGDRPDLQRPYLSTSFNKTKLDRINTSMNRFHRNPSILALGILLIEIELEKTIEECRDETEDDNVNANTDMIVADRILDSMDQCSEQYRKAIRACLNTQWIPDNQIACLENPQTRDGLCTHVIDQLEKEFDFLFSREI
ncbi:hypothetical protein MMC07_008138 [Pseudocyphellaria aurata]|nr:hypothetical protein [Pseudocyphellaria aurata]